MRNHDFHLCREPRRTWSGCRCAMTDPCNGDDPRRPPVQTLRPIRSCHRHEWPITPSRIRPWTCLFRLDVLLRSCAPLAYIVGQSWDAADTSMAESGIAWKREELHTADGEGRTMAIPVFRLSRYRNEELLGFNNDDEWTFFISLPGRTNYDPPGSGLQFHEQSPFPSTPWGGLSSRPRIDVACQGVTAVLG